MKHLNTNQEFRFNEVLFEHRNKEYGAYVLRNESDRILTKALFVGVSLLAAVSITPFVISAFKTEVPTEKPPIIFDLKDTDIPDREVAPPVIVVPPKATPAQNVKTVDHRLPEPKAKVTNEKIVEKIEGAISGTKNISEGEIAKTNYNPTASEVGKGPVVPYIPPTLPPAKKIEDNTPRVKVDVEASFEGGINSFREKVMNKFDTSGFEEGTMKTTVTFIVEKDGTISGIKADGGDASFNSEALRTIKAIKGKWIPAKVNGQNVRSYFKFPISMKFE
ncbi:energy transducer TonB [Chryseobacterium populi]|uniref:Gram-negative bacterial tonB protein n=1 Tax=Chryseobacterium populi TaxID=1144316 RepID=J2T8A3_9FLAO|nr:TonB protein [Chryseobacterium populi]EJL74317.1 Gram-negative bacterial tonB protein [Chryseobacterium populi]